MNIELDVQQGKYYVLKQKTDAHYNSLEVPEVYLMYIKELKIVSETMTTYSSTTIGITEPLFYLEQIDKAVSIEYWKNCESHDFVEIERKQASKLLRTHMEHELLYKRNSLGFSVSKNGTLGRPVVIKGEE